MPYLASARLRPAADQDGGGDSHGGEAIANPVFRSMEIRLAWRDD